MADLDKALKGLEICTTRPCYCTDCPYKKDCVLDSQEVMEDALKLLKQYSGLAKALEQSNAVNEHLSAEIERMKSKEGHWEVFTMCANEGTYCSECHTKIFDFVTPPKRKLSMFCPHCGAKMSEERISR